MNNLNEAYVPLKCPCCGRNAIFWNTRYDAYFTPFLYKDTRADKAMFSFICPEHKGPIGLSIGIKPGYTLVKAG